MIYIVHGENLSKSRGIILNHQKKLTVRYKQEFSILDITPGDLIGKIKSIDIFGEPQFFVINISGSGKTNLEDYLEVLSQTPSHTTVVLLSDKKLPNSNIFIKKAGSLKAKVLENETTVTGTPFDFVDAVLRKDRKNTYRFMHRELSGDKDPIELFALLTYGLRTLAQIKFSSPSSKSLKPFVISKNKSVSQKYSEDNLKEIFTEFYKLDMKSKTGEINPELMLTLAVEKMINS